MSNPCQNCSTGEPQFASSRFIPCFESREVTLRAHLSGGGGQSRVIELVDDLGQPLVGLEELCLLGNTSANAQKELEFARTRLEAIVKVAPSRTRGRR